MERAPLLVEIRCEEIPARMIPQAAADLAARLGAILDQAGLAHGPSTAWGGSRRVAVRVEDVAPRQEDRDEQVLGPPASAAFGAGGAMTPAGVGFARKQGIDPAALVRIKTDKGEYVGFSRRVEGREVGTILAAGLPAAVASMSFPKTMRWADGTPRWVRPVHGLLALHGKTPLAIELFGVRSDSSTEGHRFLSSGPVVVGHPDAYAKALEAAFVVADPAERRARLDRRLREAAAERGGELVEDGGLLDEIADLVEWPGVVVGTFETGFLDLPEEILITTLRHHQKSFSVRAKGRLLPVFLSVANTDRDRAGHVRRGNEWVVSGRLEDARFFWREDRKRTLDSRVADLAKVTFHAKAGSYADKAEALADLAERIARAAGLRDDEAAAAREAGRLAKTDLVTGLVGEFPELQGVVGGLLARAEGIDAAVAAAIYEHYRPAGASEAVPDTGAGAALSIADKLHTTASLIAAGETPTGSRDPFGLRRATSGIFRVLEAKGFTLSVTQLCGLVGDDDRLYVFLLERLENWLAERGFTKHEVSAVQKRKISDTAFDTWSLPRILARLEFLRSFRGHADFDRLVDLTKRIDNICTQTGPAIAAEIERGFSPGGFVESQPAALELRAFHERTAPKVRAASDGSDFPGVLSLLLDYVAPIGRFFEEVLVLDRDNLDATIARHGLLQDVKATLTQDFDIRELAGQADRRS